MYSLPSTHLSNMSLEYYFKSLRCEHADATKLVLVRDNAAGSVRGAEQYGFRRRTRSSGFDDFDGCAPSPPAAPQRAESWQSTQSLSDSLQSALNILGQTGHFRGDEDDEDVDEFGFPARKAERRQANRFNFEIACDVAFTQGLPPPLPMRMQSPLLTTGKKAISRPTPELVRK
jgi:hypothetical protein